MVPVLFTFYVQGVLKLKKSGAKRLICRLISYSNKERRFTVKYLNMV